MARLYLLTMKPILLLGCFLAALTLLFTNGCASKQPKVDWDARVGNYTYDQAVAELGPPDRQATLTDGKKVAEWIVGRTGSGGLSLGLGTFTGHTGVGVSQSIGSGPRDKVLRLTFDPNGQLLNWARN
jgi:hypothetical protein